MMFKSLIPLLERPPLYTKTTVPFWDDEHISKQMLKAHLDPGFEGASRKLAFIDKSATWIKEIAPPSKYRQLLDIGCGPGIYAERYAQMGYQVTGIDFSKRSINYAIESAKKRNLDIQYLYQNYLTMDLNRNYDFSTMIYCDYGALSTADRQMVMTAVYRHLKPGGRFLLDVFSMAKYKDFEEKQTWEICQDGGFWHKENYIAFNGCYRYPENATLEQTSIVFDTGAISYYLWNTCFTKEMLMKEAADAGFKVCEVFGDVAGSTYRTDSITISILLEK
ncbi:class I SAM-dependent methyltransferase [Lacrimispora celerecrescens]|uniref:Methyltransferase family protein n=1 Tax=[Clostridium] celerecrescens 18A TaxID=1286362 RepID=A0A2M8Z1B0_9FIRM|nr:class I SAM-dependent methyltransferase [Lacrimispora celerecrescens]PJJ27241.1 methyltransferase family protein [[Clostridium] celerecrescens 18A]